MPQMPTVSSSSSLLLIATGTLALGSLLLISRRLLRPSTATTTTTTNRLHHQYHTNLPQRRFNIRRLDLSFRVGRSRRIALLVQAATFVVHDDGSTTPLWLSIRIGGSSVEKEVNALMVLMVLRWLVTPVVVELTEEVEKASIAYLCSLRLPVIAWAIA